MTVGPPSATTTRREPLELRLDKDAVVVKAEDVAALLIRVVCGTLDGVNHPEQGYVSGLVTGPGKREFLGRAGNKDPLARAHEFLRQVAVDVGQRELSITQEMHCGRNRELPQRV